MTMMSDEWMKDDLKKVILHVIQMRTAGLKCPQETPYCVVCALAKMKPGERKANLQKMPLEELSILYHSAPCMKDTTKYLPSA